MSKNLKVFIKELQQLDELAKRRWLVGLSTIAIILVVILWAMYLNATIKPLADAETPPQLTAWDIFKNGLAVVGGKIENGLANSYWFFYNKASTGNTFVIEK